MKQKTKVFFGFVFYFVGGLYIGGVAISLLIGGHGKIISIGVGLLVISASVITMALLYLFAGLKRARKYYDE